MSRSKVPALVWQEDLDGERAGPYLVRLQEPHRWELVESGRPAGIFPTKSAARNGAAAIEARRSRWHRMRRLLVTAGASFLVLSVALWQRSEPNPDYPPARAIADTFDTARLAVEAGGVSIDEVASAYPGISGAEFEDGGRIKMGLAGVFDGACYGLVWRPGFDTGGVVIRSNYVTCAPDVSLILPPDPPGLTAEEMFPRWEDVLPDQQRSPVWFLPAFILGFGLLFGSLVRAIVLAIPRR